MSPENYTIADGRKLFRIVAALLEEWGLECVQRSWSMERPTLYNPVMHVPRPPHFNQRYWAVSHILVARLLNRALPINVRCIWALEGTELRFIDSDVRPFKLGVTNVRNKLFSGVD